MSRREAQEEYQQPDKPRELYPEIKPSLVADLDELSPKEYVDEEGIKHTYRLPVGEEWEDENGIQRHELWYAEYGNPNGIPVVVLHGGPGAGCNADYVRYFDPEKYRIIMYDQRGSGKSTPKGSMEGNNTPNLIEDLEVLRKHLNVDKWVLFGGSWGSTLALLYAETYPQNVLAMVLRGIFLGRLQDTQAFVNSDCSGATQRWNYWCEFIDKTNQLIDDSDVVHPKLDPSTVGLKYNVNLIKLYYDLLQDPKVSRKAASTFAWWEKAISTIAVNEIGMKWGAETEDGRVMGLTEVTYMFYNWFIGENQILENVGQIKDIPTWIAHGAHDYVCSPKSAYELARRLNNLNEVKMFEDIQAGHSISEPWIIHCLLQATDALAKRFLPEEAEQVTGQRRLRAKHTRQSSSIFYRSPATPEAPEAVESDQPFSKRTMSQTTTPTSSPKRFRVTASPTTATTTTTASDRSDRTLRPPKPPRF